MHHGSVAHETPVLEVRVDETTVELAVWNILYVSNTARGYAFSDIPIRVGNTSLLMWVNLS
jgi:hypothetical protein